MRPETGSNQNTKTKDIISVRIHQNGDAFVLPEVHIAAHADATANRRLAVELLSKRTMLIPSSIIGAGGESKCRREYASAGMKLFDNEELMVLGDDDIKALVAVSRSMVEELKGRQSGGGDIIYSVPLLQPRRSDKSHVILDSVDGLTTIKIYSTTGLQFADVFETPRDAQTVYWLEHLSQSLPLREYDMYIVRSAKTLCKSINHLFKNITTCE